MTSADVPPSFRLGYVPGVTPGKWVRTWNERLPENPLTLIEVSAAAAVDLVRERAADAVLLRLPIDKTDLHAIPLYTETTVAVVPKDDVLTAADELTIADLTEHIVLRSKDDTLDWTELPGRPADQRPANTEEAIQWVAAGTGIVLVPKTLARLNHRKDLTYRPVTDAAESRVALCWLAEQTSDLMEQFIGIVRGRTVNSTRGRPPAPAPAPAPKTREHKPPPAKRGSPTKAAKRGKPRRRS